MQAEKPGNTAYFILVVALLATLFWATGCNKNDPAAETGPLFFTAWGADPAALKALENNAEPVSDNGGFVVYKKNYNAYLVYVTYEFDNNQLISVFLTVGDSKGAGSAGINLVDDFELLISRHLDEARYILADFLWFLSPTTLVTMEEVSVAGQLGVEIAFYDAAITQNAALVKDFEELWQNGRWPKGTVKLK